MADQQPMNPDKQKLMPPSTKQAANYGQWIKQELRIIATLTGQVVSRERVLLTVAELRNEEPRLLVKAFSTARRECKFFPTPADIFEFIKREKNKPFISRIYSDRPTDLQEQIEEAKSMGF